MIDPFQSGELLDSGPGSKLNLLVNEINKLTMITKNLTAGSPTGIFPPHGIWVQITEWEAQSENKNLWKYEGKEIRIDENERPITVENGREFLISDATHLINLREMNNTDADGVQGNSIDSTDPTDPAATFTLLPVGAGTGGAPDNEIIVRAFATVGLEGTIRFGFEYENGLDVECG